MSSKKMRSTFYKLTRRTNSQTDTAFGWTRQRLDTTSMFLKGGYEWCIDSAIQIVVIIGTRVYICHFVRTVASDPCAIQRLPFFHRYCQIIIILLTQSRVFLGASLLVLETFPSAETHVLGKEPRSVQTLDCSWYQMGYEVTSRCV